eukprot:scaffold23779_cov112-Isochrysis_galbana.AAC.5
MQHLCTCGGICGTAAERCRQKVGQECERPCHPMLCCSILELPAEFICTAAVDNPLRQSAATRLD